jgi:hypothetical protein
VAVKIKKHFGFVSDAANKRASAFVLVLAPVLLANIRLVKKVITWNKQSSLFAGSGIEEEEKLFSFATDAAKERAWVFVLSKPFCPCLYLFTLALVLLTNIRPVGKSGCQKQMLYIIFAGSSNE